MDAFRNTISRLGIENLRPPDGRGSSCPKSVNWSVFNSRLCGGDPFDLDGFCQSISTTSDPDVATLSDNDATSSIDVETDPETSITILPDHRQTSIFMSSSSDEVFRPSTRRKSNFTTDSFDPVPTSSPFFWYTSPAAIDSSSSTANAQGHYDGGYVNVPLVITCVLTIICTCSIVLIILLSSRRAR